MTPRDRITRDREWLDDTLILTLLGSLLLIEMLLG
jgi:hypothetical protein